MLTHDVMAIRSDIHQERHCENTRQTIVIVATLGGILCLSGWIIAGGIGMAAALCYAIFAVVASLRMAPAILFKFYRAMPLDPRNSPGLHQILIALTKRAELEFLPTLYYIPSHMRNAFATGMGAQSAIGITDGILRQFSSREITGILAHEISHIKNRDTRVMALADTLSRLTATASQLIILVCLFGVPLLLATDYHIALFPLAILITAPWVGNLLQLGLSRTREYAADREAARLTGDPHGLAMALRNLDEFSGGKWESIMLPGRRVPGPSLLRTHPPIEDRIARLLELKPAARSPMPTLSPSWQPYQIARSSWQPPDRPMQRPAWHLSGLWY